MEKKNNALSLVSLCLALANIVLFIVLPATLEITTLLLICLLVCLAAAVTGIVALAQIKKNENMTGKGMAIAGTVLGVIGIFFFGLGFMEIKMIDNPELAKQLCIKEEIVNDCVDNGDGTAKCSYAKSIDITCQTEDLKDTQYK